MAQEQTEINGPHQGGWVKTPQGESWFIHFQDRGAYGRIVHLQPMSWQDGWPIIGVDSDGNGIGEPVATFRKPATTTPSEVMVPATSDEFDLPQLGLQWQWHANPQVKWGFPSGRLGFFRMNAIPMPQSAANLWSLGNLLLQKIPAETFTATAKLDFFPHMDGERIGLVVMGMDYGYLSISQEEGQVVVKQANCVDAPAGSAEKVLASQATTGQTHYLRIVMAEGAQCQFGYSIDGRRFEPIGQPFTARQGKWIGAKIGFFCTRDGVFNDAGYVNIDWFRVE